MRYILLILLGYLIYRLIRPLLPPLTARKPEKKKKNEPSSGIREEDIRDAEFKDLED